MPLIRRIPKRGFSNKLFRIEYEAVNVRQLGQFEGELVTLDLLKSRGLLKKKTKRYKVLASGTLTVKVDVEAHAFSDAARTKIESVGGTARVVSDGRAARPRRFIKKPKYVAEPTAEAVSTSSSAGPADDAAADDGGDA